MNYVMKLQDIPFFEIKGGIKKIEYRLFDSKRQQLKIGDTITFRRLNSVDQENPEQIQTQIIDLVTATSFSHLHNKLVEKGYINSEDFQPVEMYRYYSRMDELEYGVMAICITLC